MRIDGLALRRDRVSETLASATRVVQGDFEVYLPRHRDKLLFIQQPGDAGTRACEAEYVFLHFHPRRLGDLPTWRQRYGFANADFDFEIVGFEASGRCVAAVPLPDFDLRYLRTGLLETDGHRWDAPAARFLDGLL